MGRFSDYVENINQQTNLLKENLKTVTGIDCSNYSIGNCANVVLQKNNTEYVDPSDDEYVSPAWYPNLQDILNNAPTITKDDVIYYPLYAMILMDVEVISPFYKANSTSSSAVNYYRGTGGDAYIFSDVVDNNIANANDTTLQVGTQIMHEWDLTKDIGNTQLGNTDKYKIRWVIVYGTSTTTAINIQIHGTPVIEFITGNCTISYLSFNAYINPANYYCKYINFQNNTIYQPITDQFMNSMEILEKIILPNTTVQGVSSSFYFMNNCTNLKTVIMPNNFNITSIAHKLFSDCQTLKTIILPNGTSSLNGFVGCYQLSSLILPSSINSITDTSLGSCYNLKSIILPDNITEINKQIFYNCYVIENVILPNNLVSITNTNFCVNCFSLSYIKIPSTLQTWTTSASTLNYCKYIELFNDFDISGCNFTGSILKDIQWFKDLCIWLKDHTDTTPDTMILGSKNLAVCDDLYLTYNPEDKNDITWVTSGTAGAITVTEYITTVKNWTLS